MAETFTARFSRWLFRRWSKPAVDAAQLKRIISFEEVLREGGYKPIIYQAPNGMAITAPWDRPIEAVRLEWPEPHFIVLGQQPPEFNVAWLYWREP